MRPTAHVETALRDAVGLASVHHPHPNPKVGAAILDPSGRRLGFGAHVRAGQPHAERLALDAVGPLPPGSTMVVTLEPCDHTGRTPPCTEAIIEAGITRVVVAVLDPDERVSGRGVRRLREAGIEVEVLEADHPIAIEARAMDAGYFTHRTTGRAHIRLKLAATVDGQTAAADGTSRWITGAEARRDAHRLRAACDAVVVGAGTVIADDPRLDVRLAGYDGPQPRPVIVAGERPLPAGRRIWERGPLVFSPAPIELPAGDLVVGGRYGRVDPVVVARTLPEHGILDALVEGGPRLAGAFWRSGLVDAGVSYVGGLVAGGLGRPMMDEVWETLAEAMPVEIVTVRRLGRDLRLDWRPERSSG